MPLILPNTIDPDTTADAVEVEQNNTVIEQYVNTNVITRDGAVAMTNPLLLAGDPTQPNQAANKAYVDAQVAPQLTQAEADALFLTPAEGDAAYLNVTGDTATGQIKGITPVAAEDLTRKDYVDTSTLNRATLMTWTAVTGGNYPQGITTLNGNVSFIASPAAHNWTVFWYYNLEGHSTGSAYRVRIVNNTGGGTLLAVSGLNTYEANKPHSSCYVLSPLLLIAGSGINIGFQLEIGTAGANTNFGGVAVCLGVPA